MKKAKILYKTKIDGFKNRKFDILFGVFGIFDTKSIKWDYYAVSYYSNVRGQPVLTREICSRESEYSISEVEYSGKKFDTREEAQSYIETFKLKWETGSNDTTSEIRDKKIDDILK